MTKNKWIKRLRREATGNPKKAAILGLLLLVAVYFWLPLIWGWTSEGGTSVSAPAPPPEGNASRPPAVAQPSSKEGPGTTAAPAHAWQQLAAWIESDPRMVPAADLAGSCDPFRRFGITVAEKEEKPVEAARPPVVWTPEGLGLEVSSTVVGPARGAALINGRTYRTGDTIEVSKGGETFPLMLAEVHPGRVVLQAGDERFELAIPQRDLSGRIELAGSRD